MLDVARHFMPKEGVLRYLDLMAAHKLNVFHFHLTDDQGWRVEIERHPRLTEIGSWRARTKTGHRASPLWEEKPHGGYYTRDDIREIVAYAAERHITVVPEIDVPGHSQAAIAAYPELGNTDVIATDSLSVWDTWGINPNVLAPTDNTLRFYEGVFEEVLELFPSEFVHIGGDECPKDQWRRSATAQARIRELGLADEDELQSWFIGHFDAWLSARGQPADRLGRDPGGRAGEGRGRVLLARLRRRHRRRPGLPRRRHVPRAAGVSGPPSGPGPRRAGTDRVGALPGGRLPVRAGAAGADVRGGPARAGHPGQPVDRGDGGPRARGLSGIPRLAAFAEVAWSALPAPEERDFAGFEHRMTAHYRRLDALGVAYRPPPDRCPGSSAPECWGARSTVRHPTGSTCSRLPNSSNRQRKMRTRVTESANRHALVNLCENGPSPR